MSETWGVIAAILSSGLGGTAIGATRYIVGAADPLTLGALRFGIGFAFLLPVVLLQKAKWPPRSDWPGVAGLGFLFFGVFPILFNASLLFTTAARAALALSTLPLLTMVVGAIFGVEPLTSRKTGRRVNRCGRRCHGASVGSCDRSARRVAWRPSHDLRRAVHGELQYLVEAVHSPIGTHPIHHHGHERGCSLRRVLVYMVAGRPRGDPGFRLAAMGSRCLSGHIRECRHLLPLGIRLEPNDANAGGRIGHGKSDHRFARGCHASRGTDPVEPGGGPPDGARRHLDCDDEQGTRTRRRLKSTKSAGEQLLEVEPSYAAANRFVGSFCGDLFPNEAVARDFVQS